MSQISVCLWIWNHFTLFFSSVSRLQLVSPAPGWGHPQRNSRPFDDLSTAGTQHTELSWRTTVEWGEQRFHTLRVWNPRWSLRIWTVSWALSIRRSDDFCSFTRLHLPARHLSVPTPGICPHAVWQSSRWRANNAESVTFNCVWRNTYIRQARVPERGSRHKLHFWPACRSSSPCRTTWVWAGFSLPEDHSCLR